MAYQADITIHQLSGTLLKETTQTWHLELASGYKWRAPWKNRICSTTMKLRKSLLKPVSWQKTCNYIELFGSSARDRHAWHI